MGLSTTHGCFSGSYNGFAFFRNWLMEVAGIEDFEPDVSQFTKENLWGDWEETPEDPLVVLVMHYDCEGVIRVQDAGPLADRLEEIMGKMDPDEFDHPFSLRNVTQQFVEGLRFAVEAGEDVEFF